MSSAKAAVPTYIRIKSGDYNKLVVRYDDGHIQIDTDLMYRILITAIDSKKDNLQDVLEEMKAVVYEKYGKIKISDTLIEAMEDFYVERAIPRRLDYTEPRHWTTGRLPKKVREEYDEGRKEEMRQLQRDSWDTFKK